MIGIVDSIIVYSVHSNVVKDLFSMPYTSIESKSINSSRSRSTVQHIKFSILLSCESEGSFQLVLRCRLSIHPFHFQLHSHQ
jgi:hypothetical protein